MLQVTYTSLPFLFKYLIARLTICYCRRILSFNHFSLNLSFKSGFLLIVPVPVQGASTITQSILPFIFYNESYPQWNWTFCNPAFKNLFFAFCKAFYLISCKYNCPLLFKKWENAKLFPPPPAQKSSTLSPYLHLTPRAVNWDP